MDLTPLELPAWLEFNAWRTGLTAHPVTARWNDGPAVRAVLYLDRRGRIRLPPNNPYLPVAFRSARQRSSGRTDEWLRAVAPLVEEMASRGVPSQVILPPDVDDVRPWTWRGFVVGVGYSYCLDLPFDPAGADRGQRQGCEKAARAGMTVERASDVQAVAGCLWETETRKGISVGIQPAELATALHLLGPDSLRMYVCRGPSGDPASAIVVIHAPGARAIGWLAGTRTAYLAGGAGHLVWRYAFDDLASAGATGIDLCGGNIESTGTFKARWGAHLLPTFSLRSESPGERAAGLLLRLRLGGYRRARAAVGSVARRAAG